MSWNQDLAEFSQMLDTSIEAEGPMHLMRIRCSKLNEEAGEVEEAMIAFEGSNPRKERGQKDALVKELMDVAASALGAVEHLTGNAGTSARLLDAHCAFLVDRMSETLAAADATTDTEPDPADAAEASMLRLQDAVARAIARREADGG